ncbi:methyl-accepting chemotaxis protein [Desulfotruncus alcoholivorax]|uniref:methyl-accepting chemotaxis protein n=1 Tax=Desulfotruncus alcoholivorax TaxID=265477 RepID=UPI0004146555|nr:HAMP domain-containing methyl-accepting chemotaxis protein [Desulfotruncus alcoholivorax]
MRLKIGAKISLGFILMLVMIFILGSNSFISQKSTLTRIEDLDAANQRLLLEMKIESTLKEFALAMRGFIAYGDEKYYKQTEDAANKTLELENQLLQIARTDKREDVQTLINTTTKYKDGVLNELAPVVRQYHQELNAGNKEQADVYFKQMNGIAAGYAAMTGEITKTVGTFVSENDNIVKSKIKSTEEAAGKVIATSLTVTVIAIIIGVILSFFLTRMVRKPVLMLVAEANKLAGGDFTGHVEINSNDEMGELLSALQHMKNNFKTVLEGIQKSSARLNESAQQLASQAQQTSAGAAETASTMNEIAAAVDNMSQNTQDVSQQATVAAEHAQNGYRGIEMVTGQMQEIATSAEQVNTSIVSLGSAINKIGQFIEVITNIADQTNLLALNAAIEAARAGDAGRGFAVVAEEVRKLAEQSAQSTKEITQLIKEIQDQSELAVQAMSAGAEKVARGSRVVTEAGQNFSDIIKAVRDLSDRVQNVAASVQQVSAGVQNVAGTTEEQTAAMEEVSAATENLNKLAAELEALVDRFKM